MNSNQVSAVVEIEEIWLYTCPKQQTGFVVLQEIDSQTT